jgi:hypothetical protein
MQFLHHARALSTKEVEELPGLAKSEYSCL